MVEGKQRADKGAEVLVVELVPELRGDDRIEGGYEPEDEEAVMVSSSIVVNARGW